MNEAAHYFSTGIYELPSYTFTNAVSSEND